MLGQLLGSTRKSTATDVLLAIPPEKQSHCLERELLPKVRASPLSPSRKSWSRRAHERRRNQQLHERGTVARRHDRPRHPEH